MEYPKVLVISNNSFSLSNSNGRTLGLLFKGWPKDKLAQFCITTDGPDWDVCENYFCASDRQVMKRTLTLRGVKRNDLTEYRTSTSVPKTKRIKRTPIKSLVRHFIWGLGIWRRGDFNKWVAAYSPEIVIIQSGDTAFTHDLARAITNQYRAKLVFFNTEGIYFLKDNYLYKGFCDNFFFPLYHHIYKHSYQRAMQNASYAFYLNDLIKQDNDSVFDVPGKVIYNTSSLSPIPFKFNQDAPVISYFGNFGFDRSKALIELAQVLTEIDPKYKLHIYGSASLEDENLFSSCDAVDYKGFIPYDKVKEVINQSDLLVHVESNNPLYLENLRYGFSTKIADCLSSGKSFLLYAPKEIACAQYVLDNDCAWLATTKDNLKETLIELLSNEKRRIEISRKALEIAGANHKLVTNSLKFQSVLIDLIFSEKHNLKSMENPDYLSLLEIKSKEIQILQYVHNVCEQLGLVYFIGYGTLIGAVRHKGFIPWDDDIDICMPRKDYDTLLMYLHNNENGDFRLLCPEFNVDYYYEFAKVVDKHSVVDETEVDAVEGMGIWIDIFPLDYISENSIFRFFQRLCVAESFFLRVLSVYPSFPQKHSMLLWPLWKYARYIGPNKYLNRIKQISLWTKKSNLIGFVPSFHIHRDYCESEKLLNRVLLKFEDREFYAPKGYDEYLSNIYGDYMTLPPIEKRVHHVFTARRINN